MDRESGTDTPQSPAPGTLETFHLGLAADGTSCAMVFVDDHHRSIACIASYADLNGFIVSLTQAAAELARRRAVEAHETPSEDSDVMAAMPDGAGMFNAVSSDFRLCAEDGYILGALVDADGRAIPLRLRPDVAYAMTRNLLKSAQVASRC